MTKTAPSIGFATYLPPPVPHSRADGSRHFVGAVYAAVAGYRTLQLDLYVPTAAAPVPLVVWVHGGAWLFGDRRVLPETLAPDQIFDALLAAGFAVATIDYRHSKEAAFPAALHDAKAAVRWLRAYSSELGIDPHRVGIWGESAGGHLASLVGLTADRADLEGNIGVSIGSSAVSAVVDWYGVADLKTMPKFAAPPEVLAVIPATELVDPLDVFLAGADAATIADASPTSHIRSTAPPFLIVHGTADTVVPYTQSVLLERSLANAGVDARLQLVPGAGHIFHDCPDIDALVSQAVNYLAEHLQRTQPFDRPFGSGKGNQ